MNAKTHTAIRESLQSRIQQGEWDLGARIPDEIDLAEEYGCSRATVNRAVQALADQGLVIRKRKGGTRINPLPVKQAKFEIPLLRDQVEATGSRYSHQVIARQIKVPPSAIRTRLRLAARTKAFYIETVHLADDRPFAFETRWVSISAVPEVVDAPLEEISANEWLIRTMPFSSGDVMFSAANADQAIADALDTDTQTAVFVIDRTTWLGDAFITTMKLYYREGYQMYSRL